MNEIGALAGLLGALAIGVMSPGPSFVMVARLSVATSRANGLAAALGMGAGGTLFAAAALLGLKAIFLAVPTAYIAFKALGGLYLGYLGWRIFMSARTPLTTVAAGQSSALSPARSFLLGFTTQVSNPKAAIIYASVFAAFLPGTHSLAFSAMLLVAVFIVETGWYAIVATMLSAQRSKQAYLGCKTAVDRIAGTVMIGLGLKLIASAHKA